MQQILNARARTNIQTLIHNIPNYYIPRKFLPTLILPIKMSTAHESNPIYVIVLTVLRCDSKADCSRQQQATHRRDTVGFYIFL